MISEVQLREVMEGDLPIFFEQQLEPEANRMAAFPPRDREALTAHWNKILGDEAVIKKAILFNGQAAGNIVIYEQADKQLVGYWIGKEYWGRGIATRALSELLGQVERRPLYAYAAKQNVGSMRVLEKCGFALFGENKEFDERLSEEVEEFILILS